MTNLIPNDLKDMRGVTVDTFKTNLQLLEDRELRQPTLSSTRRTLELLVSTTDSLRWGALLKSHIM